MLVLFHPGFTWHVLLLKAEKPILALQRPLWDNQGSNFSELDMFGDVVIHVYNLPKFKINCSRSLVAGGPTGGPTGGGNKILVSPVQHLARRFEV